MYAYDLHIHSRYSCDSHMKINQILKIANRKRLNGISITDHNTLRGNIEAQKLVKQLGMGLNVIPGAEFYTSSGHILGLFITEDITEYDALTVIDRVHEQGGLAILAHPFQKLCLFNKELLDKVDGIEAWNSRTMPERNIRAYEISQKFNLPVLAGSDAHLYFEIGRAITLSKDQNLKESILKHETAIFGISTPAFAKYVSFLVEILKKKNITPIKNAIISLLNKRKS